MKDIGHLLVGIGVLLIGVSLLVFVIRYRRPQTYTDLLTNIYQSTSFIEQLMEE